MRAIRILRVLLNVPVTRLARSAGLSERQIQRIERGEAAPNRVTLKALDTAIETVVEERIAESRGAGARKQHRTRP